MGWRLVRCASDLVPSEADRPEKGGGTAPPSSRRVSNRPPGFQGVAGFNVWFGLNWPGYCLWPGNVHSRRLARLFSRAVPGFFRDAPGFLPGFAAEAGVYLLPGDVWVQLALVIPTP